MFISFFPKKSCIGFLLFWKFWKALMIRPHGFAVVCGFAFPCHVSSGPHGATLVSTVFPFCPRRVWLWFVDDFCSASWLAFLRWCLCLLWIVLAGWCYTCLRLPPLVSRLVWMPRRHDATIVSLLVWLLTCLGSTPEYFMYQTYGGIWG